jgi:tRNA 2-selenouridine synthase
MRQRLDAVMACLFLTSHALLLQPTTPFQRRPDTSNYRALLLSDAPMMDVRAPVEYEKGSFPSATNLPIMNNDERRLVGICHKEQGPDAAWELGNQLVSGSIKDERICQWVDFHQKEPQGYLFCFRGGLRSQTAQQWIQCTTGIRVPIVTGGYKAMRQFMLDELERSLAHDRTRMICICGATGAGKTKVIVELPKSSIDLEGLAHHRGSTFGRWPEDPEQPSQINFENSISIGLLKLLDASEQRQAIQQKTVVFIEDEGNRIGKLSLPVILRERMAACNGVIVVEEKMQERVDVILEDYVHDLGRRFATLHGNEWGMQVHRDYLTRGLRSCRNRMGGERYDSLSCTMAAAFSEQTTTGDASLHRVWIETLLEEYYDPMYKYQFEQRDVSSPELFRGKRDEVIEYCKVYAHNC